MLFYTSFITVLGWGCSTTTEYRWDYSSDSLKQYTLQILLIIHYFDELWWKLCLYVFILRFRKLARDHIVCARRTVVASSNRFWMRRERQAGFSRCLFPWLQTLYINPALSSPASFRQRGAAGGLLITELFSFPGFWSNGNKSL